jgi:hypothetical protein
MTKFAMAVLAALTCGATVLLAGCATPQEVKAADRERCAGFGFAAGSDAFANCMMQADTARQRKDDEWFRDQNKRIREEDAAKSRR